MESTSLVTTRDRMVIATQIARSKIFKIATAEAFSRIQAGAELGLPPFASISGIYMSAGRPCLSANLMAALIQKSSRYKYEFAKDSAGIPRFSDKECVLSFYRRDGEKWDHIGDSSFTLDDAKKAELMSGTNAHSWKKFPRNMLFARALSNGFRWYCPDLMGGTAWYVPDELNVKSNEDGEVIDADVCITDEQVRLAEEGIKSAGSSLEKTLSYYNVKSLKELTESDFDDLMEKITIKQRNLKNVQSLTAGKVQVPSQEVGHGQDGEKGKSVLQS